MCGLIEKEEKERATFFKLFFRELKLFALTGCVVDRQLILVTFLDIFREAFFFLSHPPFSRFVFISFLTSYFRLLTTSTCGVVFAKLYSLPFSSSSSCSLFYLKYFQDNGEMSAVDQTK